MQNSTAMTPVSPAQAYPSTDAKVPSTTPPPMAKEITVARKSEGESSKPTARKPRVSKKPAWDGSPASKPKKREVTSVKSSSKKPQVPTPSKAAACQTLKSTVAPRGPHVHTSVKIDSGSQDAEKQTKENVRENGWVNSSSISRDPSASSERPSSASSGKAVTTAETAETAHMRKLEKGWVEPDIPSHLTSGDAGQGRDGDADALGRIRVRSNAELFHRGLGGEPTDKLPMNLPAINCRAGDYAANDAGQAGTAKHARGRKTGCVGCSVM